MQEQWEILIILVIVFFIWIILMFIMMQRSTRGRRRSLCKCIGATQSSDLGNIQSVLSLHFVSTKPDANIALVCLWDFFLVEFKTSFQVAWFYRCIITSLHVNLSSYTLCEKKRHKVTLAFEWTESRMSFYKCLQIPYWKKNANSHQLHLMMHFLNDFSTVSSIGLPQ